MNTVRVKVDLTRVHIPALSTIGYGYGQLEDGTSAVIVADQRTMQGIGQAIGEGKPPIVLDAEVVATGEIADDIAEQWHDQWAISDTEGDIEQSLPVLVARPVLVAAQAEHRETEARGEGARIFAAARAQREAAWSEYEEAQARAVAAINRTTAERRRRDAAAMGAAGVTHVKVLTSADACVACRAAARYRHRLDTAPSLPIEGCTSAICRCGYLPVPAPHPSRKPAQAADKRRASSSRANGTDSTVSIPVRRPDRGGATGGTRPR